MVSALHHDAVGSLAARRRAREHLAAVNARKQARVDARLKRLAGQLPATTEQLLAHPLWSDGQTGRIRLWRDLRALEATHSGVSWVLKDSP